MKLTLTTPRILLVWALIICLLLFFWWKKKSTALPYFQFAHLFPKTTTWTLYLRIYRSLLLLVIWLCFFILSWPKRSETRQDISKSGIDIVIALDVSYSMEATDLTPNRLASAKRALQQFLSTRTSDRVGLVLFAGKPFTSLPLTFDYSIFEEILGRITTMTINQQYQHLQWTAIGDALLSSITLLDKEKDTPESKRERVIVLFTDGEANVWIDPKVVAQLAAEKSIKIYAVGIGSLEWGIINTPTAFGMRQQRVNGVDETTLRTISSQTNWLYARAVDDNSLTEILDQIAQLTRTEAEMESYELLHDASRPFVIALLIGMLLILVIDRKILV